ncbi:hypothetical protein NPS01_10080 [Nocardioides psychrotolerans]|nr:hypothetical protein [Nocardioides psychrotolerans]GEP37345.1 hypothetical protein NPS01_10080 [Nocardioides psychrotolerans]
MTPESGAARFPVVLTVLVVVLLVACGVGGYAALREHDNRTAARAEQERYGEVLVAARRMAAAFVNIDYRKPEESFEAVADNATGEFLEQYQGSSESLVDLLTSNESVMTGAVRSAAVTGLDADSATVIVATNGSVSNVSSNEEQTARDFRLRLDLLLVDGEWRTNNLEFVG